MGDRGFRSDLVSNCLNVFRQDVKSILSRYKDNKMSSVIEDYVDGSGWLNFVRTESA
jgi:hypothetical protein